VRQVSETQGETLYLNGADSLGLAMERVTDKTGQAFYKQFVQAGGRVVLTITTKEGQDPWVANNTANTNTYRFLHHDHLGSLVLTMDENRAVSERFYYDPWGKRTTSTGKAYLEYQETAGATTIRAINQIDRGYTMHEHLDELGFIHMNGRIYDPVLARFTQADPFVPDATHLQAYNRYSYVYNNPLRYADPTGYRPFHEQRWWRQDASQFAAVIVAAVVVYFMPFLIDTVMGPAFSAAAGGVPISVTWTVANPITTGAVVGATAGALSAFVATGGDWSATWKGALTGALFGAIGGYAQEAGWSTQLMDGKLKYIAAHAAAGCVSGELSNQGCGRGAAAAAFGKFVTLNTVNLNATGRGIATILAGGVGSSISGGKFGDGMYTAALGYLFNELLSRSDGRRLHSVHFENLENRSLGSGFHMYENWTPCNGGCDPDAINFQLHQRPAMFRDDSAGRTDIPGIGPVESYKDSRGVLNVTLDGHRLQPGIVARGYEVRNGVGGIATLGYGWGSYPAVNERLSGIWSSQDRVVFDRANSCGARKC
jgi:RHS repeat-associated protein